MSSLLLFFNSPVALKMGQGHKLQDEHAKVDRCYHNAEFQRSLLNGIQKKNAICHAENA